MKHAATAAVAMLVLAGTPVKAENPVSVLVVADPTNLIAHLRVNPAASLYELYRGRRRHHERTLSSIYVLGTPSQ
jgi:hypothetical protein